MDTCPSLRAAVKEISDLLNTGLDEETLKVCMQLLEAGVNPEALAAVVRELRRETAALRVRGRETAALRVRGRERGRELLLG